MRYEIRTIATVDCSRIKAEVLDKSDDLIEATELAKKRSYSLHFGAALVDTANVDFGLDWTTRRA